MTKNDRLQQIISKVRQLNDLVNNMIDAEMYPVSFFSQAFDLIQKLQSDFHSLEAEQVEMFAEQLKKHQALILTIHQQMRHFSTQTQNIITNVTAAPVIPEPEVKPEVKPKVEPKVAPEVKPEVAPTPETTELITKDEPVQIPVAQPVQPVQPVQPAQPVIPPLMAPPAPVQPPVQPPPPPVAPPVAPPIVPPAPPPAPERPVRPVPSERPVRPAPPAEEVSVAASLEKAMPSTLNDVIEKKNLSDLRKAFSLNDHFRYRKELFNGSEESMNKVITILNNHKSLNESILYLEQKLHWDFNEPTVTDFINKLEMRFID